MYVSPKLAKSQHIIAYGLADLAFIWDSIWFSREFILDIFKIPNFGEF